MIGKAFAFAILAILVIYSLKIICLLDLGRIVYNQRPGACHIVPGVDIGSEDVKVTKDGLAFISSGLPPRGAVPTGEGRGQIFTFNMKKPEAGVQKLKILPKTFNMSDFRPHGIDIYTNKKGEQLVYVINHKLEMTFIEKFRYSAQDNSLTHIKSLTHPLFKSLLNNLVMMEEDVFYTTIFRYYRTHTLHMVEIFTESTWAGIIYYRHGDAHMVAQGLYSGNGIVVSPDRKYMYVIDRWDLLIYEIRASDHGLDLIERHNTGSFQDNINVDPVTPLTAEGGLTLWLGGHPIAHRTLAYLQEPRTKTAPALVLRYVMSASGQGVHSVEQVFADDGRTLSGSSCAAPYGKHLLIGTVLDKLMYCHMN